MIKIFGMKTCPYCTYVYEQIKDDKRFRVIDIGEDVSYMHEFLALRDNDPVFNHSKEIGDIGIPCFLREDGSVSLKPEYFGLKEYSPEGASCSIDGSGC
jgi:glutaredoxin-related protein